jgi:predicted phage tail protein
MDDRPPGATDPIATIRPQVLRYYRVGLALLVAGAALEIGVASSNALLGGSTSGSTGLVIYVLGSLGVALILAGAVLAWESWSFLQRNRPVS